MCNNNFLYVFYINIYLHFLLYFPFIFCLSHYAFDGIFQLYFQHISFLFSYPYTRKLYFLLIFFIVWVFFNTNYLKKFFVIFFLFEIFIYSWFNFLHFYFSDCFFLHFYCFLHIYIYIFIFSIFYFFYFSYASLITLLHFMPFFNCTIYTHFFVCLNFAFFFFYLLKSIISFLRKVYYNSLHIFGVATTLWSLDEIFASKFFMHSLLTFHIRYNSVPISSVTLCSLCLLSLTKSQIISFHLLLLCYYHYYNNYAQLFANSKTILPFLLPICYLIMISNEFIHNKLIL